MPMIVDNAICVDGRRAKEPGSLRKTYEVCREQRGVAWIGLYKPTKEYSTRSPGSSVRILW